MTSIITAETFQVESYCDMATFSLIFYEYFITFDRELGLVWRRKFTAATVLFLLNRYMALLKYPIYIVDMFQVSDETLIPSSCRVSNVLSMVLEVLPYFVWLAFSVLRVYAICGHNWRFGLLVAIPGSFPLASNMYLYTQSHDANYPEPIGCLWLSVIPTDVYHAVILTDVLVLCLTWWRTYDVRKAAAHANIKMSLSALMLRDGMVLLVLNTFHIAFSLTGRFTWTITFEEPLTTILVSRFLLNLREADGKTGPNSMEDMSRPSFVQTNLDQAAFGGNSLHFASSFIAPLGAPLEYHGLVPQDSVGRSPVGYDDHTVHPEFEEGPSGLPARSSSRGSTPFPSHGAIQEVDV
ncbi:hypothetical protein OH77DRAFT_1427975 [Trametes cingulata]|nr:hypothetical protein OH77DRAFT_1427975 [Trametes cingulata]